MSTIDTGRPRLLTVAEAADELHVTERFVRKMIALGDLDAVEVGTRLVRIRRSSLEALLRPVHVPPRARNRSS